MAVRAVPQPGGPVLRPVVWSALLGAAVAVAFAAPAYADPGRIPDAGARPVPAGELQLPGVGTPPGASANVPMPPLLTGPLATQIYAKEVEVNFLGEKLLKLQQERDAAVAAQVAAESEWRTAREALDRAEKLAESAAAEALKDAAGLPPGIYGSDLHGLSELRDIQQGEQNEADADVAAREVAIARATEESARQALDQAKVTANAAIAEYTRLAAQRAKAEGELKKLKADNKTQLEAIERQQEALEQRLGAQFIGADAIAGKVAHPKAIKAVRYALAQLGDPYVWGAEGPNSFDCSGLTWAAYRSVGYQLPRVSRDQYYATRGKSVNRSALLPGDLIFFASGRSWTSIYHMGMYIGNGKMVQAPTTGDVVKISTVRWSRFFAATRVFDAVPAPGSTPKPPPAPPADETPSPTPDPTDPTTPPSKEPPVDETPTSPEDTSPPEDTTPPDDTTSPTDSTGASTEPTAPDASNDTDTTS